MKSLCYLKRFNIEPFSRSCIMIIVSSPPLTMYGKEVELAKLFSCANSHGEGVNRGKVVLDFKLTAI